MMRKRIESFPFLTVLLAATLSFSLCGCFGSSSESRNKRSAGTTAAEIEFPDGDPSVSATDGGPGFTGEGWTTSSPGPLGDPKAVKGGTMLTNIPNWPENLRIYGKGANTYLNAIVEGLSYETLCRLDPKTLDFVPGLASHWKISDDKMTFTFRINPKAHWSDGKSITADDVIATYRLIADDGLQDPNTKSVVADKMEVPVAKSKYIVEVRCKEKDWRNFLTFRGLAILPAHEIGAMTGKQYLDDYNFKYTAISGPYFVQPGDIKNNESLTLTRRRDYWGENEPTNTGLYNFDKIRFVVIREDRLAFDRACKGELDFYPVYTAQWWVQDLPKVEAVQKGQLIRQKVFSGAPVGTQGMAFNMRHPPLDDIRVRKAIAHLYDRKKMIDKFAFGQYERLKSYFQGGPYENPNNKLVEFDPQKAKELLAEAGWTERGTDGVLVKDGKRLSFTISYRTEGFEKYYTSLKEDCAKAGVELNLNLLTGETWWANAMDRKFEISSSAWTGSLFPSPRPEFYGELADKVGSNNITGLNNPKVDELIRQYEQEFDAKKRITILQEIDGIVFNEHPYALEWSLPCERIMWWNKFGMPATVLPRQGEWREVFSTWWVDPTKEAALKQAIASGGSLTPIPPEDFHPDYGTASIGNGT